MDPQLTEPAKLLLLASILSKGGLISKNGTAFLKELILKRDPRLTSMLIAFDKDSGSSDSKFLDTVNKLIESEAEQCYDELFSDCSLEQGKTVSKAERQEKGLQAEKSLIYGEVEFHSFAKVLRKIGGAASVPNAARQAASAQEAQEAGGGGGKNEPIGGDHHPRSSGFGTFYDLGSGTGKAVFVARFLHDFEACKGIELLTGLSASAAQVQRKYEAAGDCDPYRGVLAVTSPGDVCLVQGSILECDWSDGDVVFANSTCFDDGLMAAMAAQAVSLKPGAFFVTFTKGLNSPHFEVMERKRYKMSWGPATVYIHRRLNHDGTAFSSEELRQVPDDSEDEDEDEGNESESSESSEEDESEDESEEDQLEDLD